MYVDSEANELRCVPVSDRIIKVIVAISRMSQGVEKKKKKRKDCVLSEEG